MNQNQPTTENRTTQSQSVEKPDLTSVFSDSVSASDENKQSKNPTVKTDAAAESNTILFPELPKRSEDNASAALFAALEISVAQNRPQADTDAAQLFEDIDGNEYVNDASEENPDTEQELLPVPTKRMPRWPWITAGCILFVIAAYLTVAYIPYGPIANLRNVYIQTAMSTADHQWLATSLFSQSVIDKAWTDPNVRPEDAPTIFEGLETVGTDTTPTNPENDPPFTTDTEKTPDSQVPDTSDQPTPDTTPVTEKDPTPEKDPTTEITPEQPDILGLSKLKVGGTDYAGNKVLKVNKEEGLFISEFTGKGTMIPGTKYHGYVMLIDDPSRVFVGSTPEPNVTGYRMLDMMDHYGNVIAGINASGFSDPNDLGTGGDIIGACMTEGTFWGRYTETMSSVVLTKSNELIVGWLPDWSKYTNIRDGMQFGPVLVFKGQNQVDKSTGGGNGVHPRAAIGQREDGSIILIVIDGRVSSSIGCTLWEMADMMVKYGAVTAGGCDGGSSVVMAYDNKIINENSSANPTYGRRIPNAFLVRSKKNTK